MNGLSGQPFGGGGSSGGVFSSATTPSGFTANPRPMTTDIGDAKDANADATQPTTTAMPGDSYWQDDFRPLRDAGQGILTMLRNDEVSANGDIYQRIINSDNVSKTATNGSDAEDNPAHNYFLPTTVSNTTATNDSSNKLGEPATATTFPVDDNASTVQNVGTIPLPSYLQEKRKQARLYTMMGLFPQATLGWLVIDDTVHLWTYYSSLDGTLDGAFQAGEGSQMAEFQMPSKQPIVSVGLAPPKPGVWNELAEWCLVLTTKEEARLCVVAKVLPEIGAPWNIVATQFVVPSDWVSFLCVGSTKSGRIFLGGQDGNLYEFDYYRPTSSHSFRGYDPRNDIQTQLDRFYDGSDDISKGHESSTTCPDVLEDNSLVAFQSTTERVVNVGKRMLDAAFPPSVGQGESAPRRKFRKLNHTDGGVLKHVLPDFITLVGSFIFGGSSSAAGGAITQILVDDDRQLLYTLSSPKGWICVFDLQPPLSAKTAPLSATSMQSNRLQKEAQKLTLVAVVDTPCTARSYLESVSRGRLSPTSTAASSREGYLSFLGGAAAAQAGVGGMEGARRILRQLDSSKAMSRGGQNGGTKKSRGTGVNVLTPVSIRIVFPPESTRITIVAVTEGGLRYYLSTLSSGSIGRGPPPSTRIGQNPWKPSNHKMTMYHIRAPPPLTAECTSTTPIGVTPAILDGLHVDASCYFLGTFLVAFETTSRRSTGSKNIMVAATIDCKRRLPIKSGNMIVEYVSPGGICELLNWNLAGANGIGGGRVWEIEPASYQQSKIMNLCLHSKTPTNTELGYVVPPFTPSRMKKDYQSGEAPRNGSRAIVASSRSGALASVGFGIVTNLLLGRPVFNTSSRRKPAVQSVGKVPSYRISTHNGSNGFSMSAADAVSQMKSAPVARSARLSSWLLHPQAVPLGPLAIQHLQPFESTFVALNAGGIHSYKHISSLGQFRRAILAAGANAANDPKVSNFFRDYGDEEGCVMCFMLYVSSLSSDELKQMCLQVASRHTSDPHLFPSSDGHQSSSYEQIFKNDPWVPAGRTFKPSALCKGLVLAAARLLRPIWYKPAVVVTEGKLVKRGMNSTVTAAKVELLMDDNMINEIHRPLVELQRIATRFNVPNKVVVDLSNAALSRQIEERNIHSLQRLLSRTTQLLDLLYHLRRADFMPDLPDVEWGLLHGIQFAQFVETAWGQERIETVLNMLVTATDNLTTGPSADANHLATILSQQCFHYFSSGNRHAFLGFQAGKEALSLPPDHTRRAMLTAEASKRFLEAAKFWYSPTLVTGQLLQTQDSELFSEVAKRAIHNGSPLAKACSCLVELEDVAGVVDVCLITSQNFKPVKDTVGRHSGYVDSYGRPSWERSLYHKRSSVKSEDASSGGSPGRTVAMGTNVTPKEAIKTCYSLIFYTLSKFLDSDVVSKSYALGERMVSVCAFQPDAEFLQAFFEFMLKDNHKDVLLRVSSPDLEKWLVERQSHDPDLLMKYYQIQNNRAKAGEIARARGSDQFTEIEINDRIEYLEIAVSSFAAALAVRESTASEAYLAQSKKETEALLRIAKLQALTLQAMETTDYEVKEDAVKRLKLFLLTANDLLNNFAWPCDMFEICLLLFSACKHVDPTNTKLLWNSLICEKILPCTTRNHDVYLKLKTFVEDTLITNPTQLISLVGSSEFPEFERGLWITPLENAISRLGREILGHDADFVFPVDFVASKLEEIRTIFHGASPSSADILSLTWTFSTLVSSGISFKASFDALYKTMVTEDLDADENEEINKDLLKIDRAITILEMFVAGMRARRVGFEHTSYLDVKAIIDRVRLDIQALPNVSPVLESRLYEVEQLSVRTAQY